MRRLNLSEYRAMWPLAMFDLPVETKGQPGRISSLTRSPAEGCFYDVAVYRLCTLYPSEDAAEAHRRTFKSAIPPLGQVRVVALTDHQFAKMEVFYGRKPREPEKPPAQILLF
jgi:CRISPR-associated protein Cas2